MVFCHLLVNLQGTKPLLRFRILYRLYFSANEERNAEINSKKPYDLSAFSRKLTAGNFFSNNTNRCTMEGSYRALKNLRPALGVICANLMYLEKTPCPSGVNKVDAEVVAKYVDDMLMTLLNHPSTKSAIGAILKRMLLDLGRHQVTTKRVLSGKRLFFYFLHSRRNSRLSRLFQMQLRSRPRLVI